MNNKKNKSKNRSNPVKSTQETVPMIEKLSEIETVKSDNLNSDEVRVPDIEVAPTTMAENDPSANITPKKPKRSKGKKKKEVLLEDVKNTEEKDENTSDVKEILDSIEITKENLEESTQIIPCARKKKKKAKKLDEKLECDNIVKLNTAETDTEDKSLKLKNDESVPLDIENLSENVDAKHKDDTPKKKKKKKNRHESEKSDKYDLGTSFQKLIELPSEVDKGIDSACTHGTKDIAMKNVIELTNTPGDKKDQVCVDVIPLDSSIKYKNQEKDPPEKHASVETTESIILNDENLPLESLEGEIVTKDNISKPKAKIIKPVQKKSQQKSKSEAQKPLVDFDTTSEENVNNEILKPISPILEISNKEGEIIESKDPDTLCNSDEALEFVEVKTTKSKKKRIKNAISPVPSKPIDITQDSGENTQNIDIEDKNTIISEQVNPHKYITPDLIEYPRSTSQLCVDSNNNTLIQEITQTEEVKLEVPHDIPTPIIQGSGESPDINTNNNPVIDVTEIISQPCSDRVDLISAEVRNLSEKTDIKSKMIEVNRDMEELRRSIERSLGNLSSIEKSDTEVEKEFEQLFLSQSVEEVITDKVNDAKQIKETETNVIKDVENIKETEKSDLNVASKTIESTKSEENIKHKNSGISCGVESLKVASVTDDKPTENTVAEVLNVPPTCPARRDKNKTKSKKKGREEVATVKSNTPNTSETQTPNVEKVSNQTSEKSKSKSKTTKEKGKQQALSNENDSTNLDVSFEPIENFEDALTSSVDDVNKTFEIIAKDATQSVDSTEYHNNPKINIISPVEDTEEENKQDSRQNPITRPKNLLGHPNIPASSNKNEIKNEKFTPPNLIQAKVKIKDSVEIEKPTNNKLQTESKTGLIKESNTAHTTCLMKTNEDLIYKYSFRKVFLQNTCNVCQKNLDHRFPCKFCSLVFYCSQKHKDEDWSNHQSLCFAVSTIAHLKEQKHIYADANNISNHNYRILRMQTILSCEKILNRKLVPWEQETLLYPRICSDANCRQWKQEQLKDCSGCGQISFCIDNPEHLPSSHQRWCKSYALYQKLVKYQLTKGRLEPPLPTKVLHHYKIPEKINDVLGSLYEEKIDIDDIQYAALTQITTAPLTAAYSHQLYFSKINAICVNGTKKNSIFTIHMIGAEIPFEADSLNKWEKFFLHLRSDVQDLRVVMIGPDINSSKLPLDLLAKIKVCENCETNNRRVLFDFHENENYNEYYLSNGFVTPDIVCAFNPNIHRSSLQDPEIIWPSTISCILKQRVPFVVTSYSIEELRRDLGKIRECANFDFNIVTEIKHNPFGSVRPDRNFITDHEIPFLFKNYCFCILCGTL
ncbi:restin homolog [Bicyclus anynana]|uniref:Restin homolog n=1 Tax=Bicyclus anynana TaxID=110368 RepID=A0A6J1NWB2_BICAN|nr:restin homolog [Bicyclus anynana]